MNDEQPEKGITIAPVNPAVHSGGTFFVTWPRDEHGADGAAYMTLDEALAGVGHMARKLWSPPAE